MGGRKINFEKGTKVNNLTIIEPSEKRTAGGSVKWLCICDCGQECYVDSSRLKSGLAKSCGCLSKQALIDGREIHKIVDKTGRRYGRLVVLERDLEKEKTSEGIYWKCKCDCGEYTTIRSSNLRENNSSTQTCGKCRSSHGQNKIRNILKQNNIYFIEEYRFPDCKNIRPLPFDFYLPDYNICIEYDGRQHFEYDSSGWNNKEQFDKIKKTDAIKNKYCQENGISLIRIPYFDYDNIQLTTLIPILKNNADVKSRN